MVSSMTEGGIGERKLRDNRKRFHRLVWLGLGMGLVIGLVAGIVTGYTRAAQRAGDTGLEWLAWPVLIAAFAAFIWYTRHYFRKIDELDLLDNLWASTVGLYAFVMAYPAWALLHEIGQAGAPQITPLWWGSMAAAGVAYGWRKLRHRF